MSEQKTGEDTVIEAAELALNEISFPEKLEPIMRIALLNMFFKGAVWGTDTLHARIFEKKT